MTPAAAPPQASSRLAAMVRLARWSVRGAMASPGPDPVFAGRTDAEVWSGLVRLARSAARGTMGLPGADEAQRAAREALSRSLSASATSRDSKSRTLAFPASSAWRFATYPSSCAGDGMTPDSMNGANANSASICTDAQNAHCASSVTVSLAIVDPPAEAAPSSPGRPDDDKPG